MTTEQIQAELRAYRAAQEAYRASQVCGAAAAVIFERLLAFCLEAYGGQEQAPALFAAICRGPRDGEMDGEWAGVETPITDTDGRRVQALWLAATGRARSMMDAYAAMGFAYGA